MYYNGFELVENKYMTKGYTNIPKRRNKNKRIQKKWIKRYGYLPAPDPGIYFFNNKFYGHPTVIRKIIKAMKNAV